MQTDIIPVMQPGLFDDVEDLERKVRSRDQETSWTGAALVKTTELRGIKVDIIRILSEHGPLTDDAIFAYYIEAGGRRTAQRIRSARAEMTTLYRGQVPVVRRAEGMGVSEHGGDSHLCDVIS